MQINPEKIKNLAEQFKADLDRGPWCSSQTAIGKVGKVTFLLVALDEEEALDQDISPVLPQNEGITE